MAPFSRRRGGIDDIKRNKSIARCFHTIGNDKITSDNSFLYCLLPGGQG